MVMWLPRVYSLCALCESAVEMYFIWLMASPMTFIYAQMLPHMSCEAPLAATVTSRLAC